jgi:hypothetical protein
VFPIQATAPGSTRRHPGARGGFVRGLGKRLAAHSRGSTTAPC